MDPIQTDPGWWSVANRLIENSIFAAFCAALLWFRGKQDMRREDRQATTAAEMAARDRQREEELRDDLRSAHRTIVELATNSIKNTELVVRELKVAVEANTKQTVALSNMLAKHDSGLRRAILDDRKRDLESNHG